MILGSNFVSKSLVLAVSALSLITASPSVGQTIKAQGGGTYLGKFQNWYADRQKFEGGIKVCTASVFSNNRRMPAMSMWISNSEKTGGLRAEFYVKVIPAANATADVIVGDQVVRLVHRAESGANSYQPTTFADNKKLIELLLARDAMSAAWFTVKLSSGRSFQMSANGAAKALDKIQKSCGS